MAGETRTAIVTGAGSGIGRATALQLAREGADVAAADINGETARATAEAIAALGRRSLAVQVDVRDKAQVQAGVKQVLDAWGRIDILVACAGIFPRTAVVDLAEDEWDSVVDTHVKGTFLMCQAVLPTMMEQRAGRIVTTVSGLATAGQPRSAAYAAGKGAIIGFTRVLANEAMPHGMTVNAFGPGATNTPMVQQHYKPEEMDVMHQRAPFGRLPEPEQSAELAVFFTRPQTAHLTGRIFVQ
jgi:NAD(P)-dependent dehydrogenase (short-subunit alcohol dehydrogenase family)